MQRLQTKEHKQKMWHFNIRLVSENAAEKKKKNEEKRNETGAKKRA